MSEKTRILEVYERIGLFKNKMIGSDMHLNPFASGTSFPALLNNTLTADKWKYFNGGSSAVHTVSKVVGEADGRSALRIEATTADVTVAAGDFVGMLHTIEGFLIIPLIDGGAFFTARMRSDVTGIQSIALRNAGNDRSFVHEFNIAVANVFQDVQFFIDPLPVEGGTWDFTTGAGLDVFIPTVVGSTFQAPSLDQWVTGNFLGGPNQVNRNAAVGNNIEFDRTQIEQGTVFTDFAHIEKDQVLNLCKRYFEMWTAATAAALSVGTGGMQSNISGIVDFLYYPKRIPPSLTALGAGAFGMFDFFTSQNVSTFIFSQIGLEKCSITATATAAFSAQGRPLLIQSGGTNLRISIDANI